MAICPVRESIKTGDLIAWNTSPGGSDSFWFRVVRFFTMSEYGHVSVAVKENGKLYHIEARRPSIRKALIKDNVRFFVVPLSKHMVENPDLTFLTERIGQKYSYMDAFRAYFGKVTKHDDRWQCAELTAEFYAANGLDLLPVSLTPSNVVKAAMLLEDLHLARTCSELKTT